MEHTKHIWRAVLILIAAAIGGICFQHFMVPESFGETGFYRHDSLAEYMAQPLVHGDTGSCAACHQKNADTKAAGSHAGLSCEPCHAPLSAHVQDNAKYADMPLNKSKDLCLNCHLKLRARPEKHPQIDPVEHLVAQGVISAGEPVPDEACISCHDPHSPKN